ncbi:hypothetical protein BH09BAC3_BH09BAC3_32090 [soil metagenome]
MKLLLIVSICLLFGACSSNKTYHTVNVAKPIYHHGWYKNSRWHKKIQVGRVRIRWFEKQGVKSVKMKG